ncbi:uncharacterized protein [Spinacia oleracea]|uniref:Uncharacterized protein isoform X3 n=1 Tax=Spinacia oleracea TaxID=3562 RepID=A0ABM3R2J4_SPIOL|nr:uncharacterized protein LOC110787873 isoform X3 [Spinacia oleracea]
MDPSLLFAESVKFEGCEYYKGDQDPIPVYLLSKLKCIEILEEVEGNEENSCIPKLVDYILSKENVLKRLYISSFRNFDDGDDCRRRQLWGEYEIYNMLVRVPKSSLPNEVEFVGHYIRVSRHDKSQTGLIVTFKY